MDKGFCSVCGKEVGTAKNYIPAEASHNSFLPLLS